MLGLSDSVIAYIGLGKVTGLLLRKLVMEPGAESGFLGADADNCIRHTILGCILGCYHNMPVEGTQTTCPSALFTVRVLGVRIQGVRIELWALGLMWSSATWQPPTESLQERVCVCALVLFSKLSASTFRHFDDGMGNSKSRRILSKTGPKRIFVLSVNILFSAIASG